MRSSSFSNSLPQKKPKERVCVCLSFYLILVRVCYTAQSTHLHVSHPPSRYEYLQGDLSTRLYGTEENKAENVVEDIILYAVSQWALKVACMRACVRASAFHLLATLDRIWHKIEYQAQERWR